VTSGQWDKTVALYIRGPSAAEARRARRRRSLPWEPGGLLDKEWFLGSVARNTRLFLAGDVVIMQIQNGQAERQPVFGVSGRGYSVKNFYMQYARWEHEDLHRRFANRTPVKIVEVPGRLEGVLPTDPALRRFVVESLCTGTAGPPVSADTGPYFWRGDEVQ